MGITQECSQAYQGLFLTPLIGERDNTSPLMRATYHWLMVER